MTDKPVVHFDVEDGVGVITIDYPPVNALGPGVADGIMDALDRGEADDSVKAFVLIGAGRSFIAGADIKGFGKGRPKPKRRTYDVLDTVSKPVVAAIHGYALGGGLENALAGGVTTLLFIPGSGTNISGFGVLLKMIPGGPLDRMIVRELGAMHCIEADGSIRQTYCWIKY